MAGAIFLLASFPGTPEATVGALLLTPPKSPACTSVLCPCEDDSLRGPRERASGGFRCVQRETRQLVPFEKQIDLNEWLKLQGRAKKSFRR